MDTALQGMGGALTAEPSVVVPMPDVLGDESSGSEVEGAGSGDASPPREGEAVSTGLHRPTAGLVEVSEDEAEASSLVALFQNVRFQATDHHAEDVGGSNTALSPLHLGKLPLSFVFPLLFVFPCFIGTYFYFPRGFDGGPWEN